MTKQVHLGTMEDLSDQQRQVLDQLRTHLRKELGNTDPRYDDRYLLRFCRARKFDYPKVQLMFDNFLAWRAKNGVDKIAATLDISPMEATENILPHNYYCVDKLGRPVYIERYKNFDLKEITDRVDKAFMLNYYIYGYERLLHVIFKHLSIQNAPHVIEQSVTILDLDGLAFTKIISKRNEIQDYLKMSSAIAQDNYPEIMGKLFIINAPMLFNALWSVAKGFLDEKTVSKISILGSGYKKDLLKVIDEEQLPSFMGGKNPRTLKDGIFEDLFRKAKEQKSFFIKELYGAQTAEYQKMSEGKISQQPEALLMKVSSHMSNDFGKQSQNQSPTFGEIQGQGNKSGIDQMGRSSLSNQSPGRLNESQADDAHFNEFKEGERLNRVFPTVRAFFNHQ